MQDSVLTQQFVEKKCSNHQSMGFITSSAVVREARGRNLRNNLKRLCSELISHTKLLTPVAIGNAISVIRAACACGAIRGHLEKP